MNTAPFDILYLVDKSLCDKQCSESFINSTFLPSGKSIRVDMVWYYQLLTRTRLDVTRGLVVVWFFSVKYVWLVRLSLIFILKLFIITWYVQYLFFPVLRMSDTIYVAHIREVIIAHGTKNKRPLPRMRRCPLCRGSFPAKIARADFWAPGVRRCSLWRGAHI